jgi:DNA-binding response OmpR family regulator
MIREDPLPDRIAAYLKQQEPGRYASLEEIAENLGTTKHCVRVLVYKLRKKLENTDETIEIPGCPWHFGYRIVKRKT